MKSIEKYIESGILEAYVLGTTNAKESVEVEEMAAANSLVRAEINMIRESIEKYAELHAIEPAITVKPFVLAIIDYNERLKKGEPVTIPPILHDQSTIADYADWLKAKDAILPDNVINLHARLIGLTPEAVTAIVWIKDFTPSEVHYNELEKFLIVEGTCNITIGEQMHKLVPGDMLSIPLYIKHMVKVTSEIPCKVILQRLAA